MIDWNSLKNNTKMRITATVKNTSREMLSIVMPKMLPHNMERAAELIAVWGTRFKKINPREIINEKIIPRMTLVGNFAFSARGPNRTATPTENTTAINNGFTERTSPRAAPAKAA